MNSFKHKKHHDLSIFDLPLTYVRARDLNFEMSENISNHHIFGWNFEICLILVHSKFWPSFRPIRIVDICFPDPWDNFLLLLPTFYENIKSYSIKLWNMEKCSILLINTNAIHETAENWPKSIQDSHFPTLFILEFPIFPFLKFISKSWDVKCISF